jgi:hypothetical protein
MRREIVMLAAALAGLNNHEERMRCDPDYGRTVKNNQALLREYHATLGIANRLTLLARDCQAPASFDTKDLLDGALHPPFVMRGSEERAVIKAMRSYLSHSPAAKIEVTPDREIVLLGNVYDESDGTSSLEPICSTVTPVRLWKDGIWRTY